MLRRKFGLLLFFALLAGAHVSSGAEEVREKTVLSGTVLSDARQSDIVQSEAVYNGTMDVIVVKGKNYEPREATYSIGDGKLLCDFPKIGRMPGKIRIELPVTIHEDGSLTAEAGEVAGVMKMPMGIRIKLRLSALKDARVTDESISFTLDVYGKFMGANFPTSVHFRGDGTYKDKTDR